MPRYDLRTVLEIACIPACEDIYDSFSESEYELSALEIYEVLTHKHIIFPYFAFLRNT